MKLKHILLVAAAALTLSLVSVEIAPPEDPGSKPGLLSGSNEAIAASEPTNTGDFHANGSDVYHIAGSKLGIASGTN